MEGLFPVVDILGNAGIAGELKKPCRQESCSLETCLRQIRCSIEQLLATQEQRHQVELDKLRNSAFADPQIFAVAEDQEHQGQLTTMSEAACASEPQPSYDASAANDTFLTEFTRDMLDGAVPSERHAVQAGLTEVDLHERTVFAEPQVKTVRKTSQRRSGIQHVHFDLKSSGSVGRNSSASTISGLTVASEHTVHSVTSRQSGLTVASEHTVHSVTSRQRITTMIEKVGRSVGFGKVPAAEAIRQSLLGAQGWGEFSLLELLGTALSQMLEEDILDKGIDFQALGSVAMLHHPRSARISCNKTCLELIIFRPRSRLRCCWDFASIFVTLYDIAMSPMFIYEFDETDFDLILFWFTLSFWSLDIVLSFFTGYQVEGDIEMRFKKIVLNYLKGWFAIDTLAVMPDWIALLFSGDRASGSIARLGRAAKFLRILRSLRLLRVFRLLRAWNGLRETVTNEYLVFTMQFAKLVILMLLLSHFSACAWYGISKFEKHHGWVYKSEVHSKDRFYVYLTSLHWATSQLHGSMAVDANTHLERSYAISYLYVGLIAASMFVSSITNVFLKMQKLREETFLKTYKLLSYLEDNDISTDLTARIQCFASQANDVRANLANQVELLKILPDTILEDLSKEIKYQATKHVYPLTKLCGMLPQVERGFLIDALSQTTVSPGAHLFHKSEMSGKMFILWRGKVIYDPKLLGHSEVNDELSTESCTSAMSMEDFMDMKATMSMSSQTSYLKLFAVEACCCMAEMNLWTNWQHQGDCIISTNPVIFSISAQSICDVLHSTQSQNMQLKVKLSLFISQYVERYLAWLNTMEPCKLTDLSVPAK